MITVGDADTTDNYIYGSYGQDDINAGENSTVSITMTELTAGNTVKISGGDTLDFSRLDTANLQSTTIDLTSATETVTLAQIGSSTTQRVVGIEHVVGTSTSDTITGTSGSNHINSGAGNDTIFANGGSDFINGGSGDEDKASFSKGVYSSGIDINYSVKDAWYKVTNNTDNITSTTLINVERFEETQSGDKFAGSQGVDFFEGGAGNDTIDATKGGDTYDGGAGIDRIDYSRAGTTGDTERFVSKNMAQLVTPVTIALISAQAFGNQSLLINNLSNEYASYSPEANLTGLRLDMAVITDGYFEATYAEQTANGLGAILRKDKLKNVENIKGSENNDYLAGNGESNNLEGFDGHDFIAGRGGNDSLKGGKGNDILLGGMGSDTLDGGEGNDWASYQFSNIGVQASLKDGTATGGEGSDTLINIENLRGTTGADTLTGNTGTNHLIGGKGDDTLAGMCGQDALDGGEGVDTASFSDAVYASGVRLKLLSNTNGNISATYKDSSNQDVLVTLKSIENCIGSTGSDVMSGNLENNTILGGAGNDTLDGGSSGVDVLRGELGDDKISYTSRAGTLDGGAGSDTLDLGGVSGTIDIDLSSANQAVNSPGLQITNFENVIAGEGNIYHIYFNDAGGDGNNLHLVVNVV